MISIGIMLSIDFDLHISLLSLITNGSQRARYAIEIATIKITKAITLVSTVDWKYSFVYIDSLSTRCLIKSPISRY
jgi:hypothetical protein